MNIIQFARICDVCKATISNCFAHPERVGAKTRERILALAEQHGYRPSLIAGAITRKKTFLIGVMVFAGNRYFRDIAQGVQNELLKSNYLPLYLRTNWKDRLKLLHRLTDQRVDGIITINPRRDMPENAAPLAAFALPHVLVDSRPDTGEDWVDTDDFNGGIAVAEHLLRLGHHRVCLYGTSDNDDKSLRFEGFRERYRQENIEVPQANDLTTLKFFLTSSERPTAVFAFSDSSASECYTLAASLGLKIPMDLSVVGYADLDIGKYLSPLLTTVRQDGVAVGTAAAELLLKRISDKETPQSSRIIPVTLCERASTAPAPRS